MNLRSHSQAIMASVVLCCFFAHICTAHDPVAGMMCRTYDGEGTFVEGPAYAGGVVGFWLDLVLLPVDFLVMSPLWMGEKCGLPSGTGNKVGEVMFAAPIWTTSALFGAPPYVLKKTFCDCPQALYSCFTGSGTNSATNIVSRQLASFKESNSRPVMKIESVKIPSTTNAPLEIVFLLEANGTSPVAVAQADLGIYIGNDLLPWHITATPVFPDEKRKMFVLLPGQPLHLKATVMHDSGELEKSWCALPTGEYELRIYAWGVKDMGVDYQWQGYTCSDTYKFKIKERPLK